MNESRECVVHYFSQPSPRLVRGKFVSKGALFHFETWESPLLFTRRCRKGTEKGLLRRIYMYSCMRAFRNRNRHGNFVLHCDKQLFFFDFPPETVFTMSGCCFVLANHLFFQYYVVTLLNACVLSIVSVYSACWLSIILI